MTDYHGEDLNPEVAVDCGEVGVAEGSDLDADEEEAAGWLGDGYLFDYDGLAKLVVSRK